MTGGGSGGVWGIGRSNRSGPWRHAALGINREGTAHDVLGFTEKGTTHGALGIVGKRRAMRESKNELNRYAVNVYKHADNMQVVKRRRMAELVVTCIFFMAAGRR